MTRRLTRWQFETSYRQITRALDGAERILALGESEKAMIVNSYGMPAAKVDIVPNGIAERFYQAGPNEFRARCPDTATFVLSVGSISPYKNQLGLIDALADTDIDVVLIGACESDQRDYLDRCMQRRSGRVHYLGAMAYTDPLLAYAAAGVFALPSRTEVAPLVALESLAAGTPVVLTRHHSLDIATDGVLFRTGDPSDRQVIRAAVCAAVDDAPDPASCRRLVERLQWRSVAQQIAAHYGELTSAI